MTCTTITVRGISVSFSEETSAGISASLSIASGVRQRYQEQDVKPHESSLVAQVVTNSMKKGTFNKSTLATRGAVATSHRYMHPSEILSLRRTRLKVCQ